MLTVMKKPGDYVKIMVTRYYICDHCGYSFEIQQNMHDRLKRKCPSCKSVSLYQDLSGQHTFVYQDPKTLGHLADRNTERSGKYELEAKREDHAKVNKIKREKNKTWYNPDGKNLKNEMSKLDTAEKKHKYIMGED